MRNNLMIILVPLISVAAWISTAPPVRGEDGGRLRSVGNNLVMSADASVVPAEGVPRVSPGIAGAVDESGEVPSRNLRTERASEDKEAGRVEGTDSGVQGNAPKAPGAPKGLRAFRVH